MRARGNTGVGRYGPARQVGLLAGGHVCRVSVAVGLSCIVISRYHGLCAGMMVRQHSIIIPRLRGCGKILHRGSSGVDIKYNEAEKET